MTIEIPLSKHGKNRGKYIAIVDDCDSDLALQNWFVFIAINTVYAIRFEYQTTTQKSDVRMHRVIMERIIYPRKLEKDEYADHINGDGWDNRRSNLRVATRSQNNVNTKRRKDNTSGQKGVSFSKQTGKFLAYISSNGNKRIRLGLFDKLEDAIKARQDAEKLYHGEFVRRE